MARDWLDCLATVEAMYQKTVGGSSSSEPLRLQLVPFANNALKEIERLRRWSLSYGTAQQLTTAGTATYAIPAAILSITNLYYLDANGYPHALDDYTARELRQVYGEGTAPPTGPPRGFAILGANVQIFPAPDAAGPTSGNYTLIFEGYQTLQSIIETTSAPVALSTSLPVPSTGYLTAKGLAASGTTGVSIRGAGYPQSAAVTDNWITNWSAFPDATHVTLTTAPITATGSTAQTFFNSTNWLISDFPKVLEFAVLREVSSYLMSADYQQWEARYQHELDLMAERDFDRLGTLETLATAQLGQRQNQLRRLDYPLGYEVRGGLISA